MVPGAWVSTPAREPSRTPRENATAIRYRCEIIASETHPDWFLELPFLSFAESITLLRYLVETNMVPPLRVRALPASWRFALIGALISLPITAVINWLPNSESTIGAGIMIVGGFIAGIIAAIRSTAPGAAGLRAGFLGGVLTVFAFIVTRGTTTAWPLSKIVFFAFAAGAILIVAPLFGLGCGLVGG